MQVSGAGGAEREARELAEMLVKQIWPLIALSDFMTERDAIERTILARLTTFAARCANEARLEALEQAACEIDKCNQEGPYQAIAGAERIRALKAAPLDPSERAT